MPVSLAVLDQKGSPDVQDCASDSWRDELCGRGEVLLRATRLPPRIRLSSEPTEAGPMLARGDPRWRTHCPLLLRRGRASWDPKCTASCRRRGGASAGVHKSWR